jgi:hypothetical protein
MCKELSKPYPKPAEVAQAECISSPDEMAYQTDPSAPINNNGGVL